MANKTTLQITSSNPNLIIENNFTEALEDVGVIQKDVIYEESDAKVIDFNRDYGYGFYINDKNELFLSGQNAYGQAGTGQTGLLPGWTKIADGAVSAYTCHNTTMYLSTDNILYFCGQDNHGCFGTKTAKAVYSSFIPVATNVKSFTCGEGQSYWYIDLNNDLYGCGANYYGNQGNNNTTTVTTFTKRASNVKKVACYQARITAYINMNNDLYLCGAGYGGVQGSGNTNDVKKFTKRMSNVKDVDLEQEMTAVVSNSGDLYLCGKSLYQLTGSVNASTISTLTKRKSNVRKVMISDRDCYYITNDNVLYGWGRDAFGNFGQGDTMASGFDSFKMSEDVVDANSWGYGVMFIKSDGRLYATGSGNYNVLGYELPENITTPLDITPKTLAWTCDGNNFDFAQYNITVTGTPSKGDTINLKFTTVPPTQTRLTVKASNPTLTINNNYEGTLQDPGVINETFTYGIGYNNLKAKVTSTNICYVDSFGDLYLRGNFENATGGDGTLESVTHNDTKIASNVKQVGGSYNNTYYITNSGDLYVAGKNAYGQLATGNTEDVLEFTKIAQNVKDAYLFNHLLYVKENGDLYVCGENTYGQLGIGSTTNSLTPVKVASNVDYVTSNGADSWYISKGELYGCGKGADGNQGSGNDEDVLTFTKRAENVKLVNSTSYTTQYITNDNKLFGCGTKKDNLLFNGEIESGSYYEFVHCADDVKYMYADTSIQYYVKTNGDLYVVGDNTNGFYGDGESTPTSQTSGSTPVKVAENVDRVGFCHYYDMEGHLFLCGDNTHGQIMPQIQTFNLRATSVPTTHIPWTDITPSEEGWMDENDNLVNLSSKGVEIQGEPQPGDTVQLTFSTRRLQAAGLDLVHGDRVGFRFVTRQDYNTLLEQDAVTGNLIYAITDENILMLANSTYSINNRFVEEYPENPAQGVLYFNTKTRGVKMFNGVDWTFIVPDVENTLTAETLDENLLTAKAIKDFVDPLLNDGLVKDVTYNVEDQLFNIEHINGQVKQLPLRNLLCGVSFDNDILTFNKLGGDDDVLNLPSENYLIDSTFDGQVLTLILKNGVKVTVDLFDLLTIFTGQETESAIVTFENKEMTINAKLSQAQGNAIVNLEGLHVSDYLVKSIMGNEIVKLNVEQGALSADIQISQAEGNSLQIKEDGLYTNRVPLENYYDSQQMNELLDAEKDQAEFDADIELKVNPDVVYTKQETYNKEEVKPQTVWLHL